MRITAKDEATYVSLLSTRLAGDAFNVFTVQKPTILEGLNLAIPKRILEAS